MKLTYRYKAIVSTPNFVVYHKKRENNYLLLQVLILLNAFDCGQGSLVIILKLLFQIIRRENSKILSSFLLIKLIQVWKLFINFKFYCMYLETMHFVKQAYTRRVLWITTFFNKIYSKPQHSYTYDYFLLQIPITNLQSHVHTFTYVALTSLCKPITNPSDT